MRADGVHRDEIEALDETFEGWIWRVIWRRRALSSLALDAGATYRRIVVHAMSAETALAVHLRRYRPSLGLFIAGLVCAGLTAFPIAHELRLASSLLGIDDPSQYANYTGLREWIAFADHSVRQTYAVFPSAGYGTDWLAFAHLAVALFAIGPWRDPVRNGWAINCFLATCVGVIPLALICGAIREIPVFWRLLDCSFGVVGAIPLLYCRSLEKKLAALTAKSNSAR